VAYGSTAPMRAALLQGGLQVGGLSMTDATQEMAAGTLRPLGQMAAERWAGTPDVPTLREQGFDVVLSSLRGFAAPAGTPPAIVQRLSDLIGEAARDPGFRALAEKQAMPIGYQDSATFAAGIAAMQAQYEKVWREQPWRERD
jgi:tripartite-type tricarboxylate transporter receptor subunit TctC